MLTAKDISEFKEYLQSGRWDDDFGFRSPDGQAEMLDLVESLFELCEIADEVLTRRLYKQMSGTMDRDPVSVSLKGE